MSYFYAKLRNRAKERGHSFTLTLEQYTEFAMSSGYLDGKGKTAGSLSINRKLPEHGYHVWNIEAITLSMNSRMQYTPIPDAYRNEILAHAKANYPPPPKNKNL